MNQNYQLKLKKLKEPSTKEKEESKYILIKFFIISSKKACLKDSLKKVCEIWRKDPSSEKVVDALYLLTAKEFEYCFSEKLNASLADLPDEDVAELMKFFYMTYQRITEEKNCLSLKPGKIFPIHQELIEKKEQECYIELCSLLKKNQRKKEELKKNKKIILFEQIHK